MMNTHQVTLDNGKGQGAYGLGSSTPEAAFNAFYFWHRDIGRKAPKRACLTTADDGRLGGPNAFHDFTVSVMELRREARKYVPVAVGAVTA